VTRDLGACQVSPPVFAVGFAAMKPLDWPGKSLKPAPTLSLTLARARPHRICRRRGRSYAVPPQGKSAGRFDPPQLRARSGPSCSPQLFVWAYYYGRFFSGAPTESIGTTPRPNALSIMILSVPCIMRSMVSKYMRLRVTSGAFLYSS
jgi:hypothetical protein